MDGSLDPCSLYPTYKLVATYGQTTKELDFCFLFLETSESSTA